MSQKYSVTQVKTEDETQALSLLPLISPSIRRVRVKVVEQEEECYAILVYIRLFKYHISSCLKCPTCHLTNKEILEAPDGLSVMQQFRGSFPAFSLFLYPVPTPTLDCHRNSFLLCRCSVILRSLISQKYQCIRSSKKDSVQRNPFFLRGRYIYKKGYFTKVFINLGSG